MTEADFLNRLVNELTAEEISLYNFVFFMNPQYIDYYMDYHKGKYDKCYRFVLKNRHLLKEENIPDEFKKPAMEGLKIIRQREAEERSIILN
jgi:hypothetical protein